MSQAAALSTLAVTQLKGVGPKLAERLTALHIRSVQDLLFHLPLRYQDRTRIAPIGSVRLGQDVMLQGNIVSCDIEFGRRRSLVCRLRDATGMITLRFFHFSAAQKRMLEDAAQMRCFLKPSRPVVEAQKTR